MPLKTPAEYIESLRDGRVTYWAGERIEDVTTHPRFRVPLKVASGDYDYGDPAKRDLFLYETEDGSLAHRIFQIPREEKDLTRRLEMMERVSLVGGVTGVFMALMSVRDAVAKANPAYAENIERLYRFPRDNDLRAAEVITDAKGDRKRRAHEQDDPDLYVRIVIAGARAKALAAAGYSAPQAQPLAKAGE